MTVDTGDLRCPACGSPTLPGPRSGPCPACLLRLALEDDGAGDECGVHDDESEPGPEYRVVTLLDPGEGVTTYLARRVDGCELVELSVAPLGSGLSSEAFMARVRQMTRLRHPGLARVFAGRMTDQGDCCLVAEYVAGQPVAQYCERVGIAPHEAMRLFDQACVAIAYAHANGVAHGSLRPESVLAIAAGPTVAAKVTGWGVCAARSSPDDDVAGLAGILRTLALVPGLSGSLVPVLDRVLGAAARRAHESVGALRAAAAIGSAPAP